MAKITGVKKHTQRLKNAANVAREVTAALYSAGQDIELDAEHSITQGGITGDGHVPSLPGQPPNRDTGDLDGSIETKVIAQNPPTVHVTAGGPKAPHAVPLEFGTSKMAERPYMRPATEKNRKNIGQKVAQAVRVKIRRG